MSLSIRVLTMGTLVGMNKPTITYQRGWGATHDSALLVFVIDGGDGPIIVDTGPPPDAEWVWKYHGYKMEQGPHEHPVAVIKAAGIDPAEVKTVVNTHLHWDHCSNNSLFPNATFVVQRREMEYAMKPVQWHNASFEHLPGVEAPWERVRDHIETVDGDVEVAPGISVVALPGHTPGSQGVLVDTGRKRYLIAGDCVDTYENWLGDEAASHIPSGFITNIIEYEASFEKIERFGCEVIPSHDLAVLQNGPFT